MTLFDLVAKLTMDSSGFDKGVRDAENAGHNLSEKMGNTFNKIEKVAKAVVGGAVVKKVVGTLKELVDETAQVGDKIDKQSQVLGMSRKAYQEWDYILGQNGASIESMGTAMKTLNSLILSGAEGSKESGDALAQLGLHLGELETLSQEGQFEAVVRAFQKMPAGAQKSALAVKIFGKQGMQLLPLLNQSETSIDELRQRAEELGLIMSDDAVDASVAYGDSLDTLKRTFDGFKYSIGSKILPILTTGMEKVTNFAGKLRKAYDEKGLAGVWDTLVDAFKNIKWPTWEDVSTALESAWNGVKEGAKSVLKLVFGETADGGIDFPTPSEIWEKIKSKLSTMWKGIQTLSHTILKLIFGEDADGNITFPTADEIKEKVKTALGEMWKGVQAVFNDIGALVFGTDENGNVKWPTAHELGEKVKQGLTDAWEGVKNIFKTIGKLIFGEGDGGIQFPATGEEWWNLISSKVTELWSGVKSLAKSVINFALGVLGLPDIDATVARIKTWWANVKKKIKLSIQVNLFGFNPSQGQSWSQGVQETNSRFGINLPQLSQEDIDRYADDSFAIGTPSIPYDNFLANLHRGERVLSASQARDYREGGSGFDAEKIASSVANAVKSAIESATIRSYINGKDITDEVNRSNIRAVKARRFAT